MRGSVGERHRVSLRESIREREMESVKAERESESA